VIAGGNVLAGGGGLGVDQRQRQVAIAPKLTAGALFQIQPVGGPQHPGTQLCHAILAFRLLPAPSFAGPGSVGPGDEIQGHPAHDELRRFRGEPRVTPPAQAALDIGIHSLDGLGTVVLSVHPGPEQPGLKAIPRIFLHQGPGRHVHGEPGVIRLGNPVVGDEQIAGHLASLNLIRRAAQRHRGQDERQTQEESKQF